MSQLYSNILKERSDLLTEIFHSGYSALRKVRNAVDGAAAVNRLTLRISRIIPGDWGTVEPGWLVQPLYTMPKGRRWRQDSPVPLATFARCQNREVGTVRRGAIRSCSKSSQVTQAGFEPGRIAVTRGYLVATVYQHGRAARAVSARRSAKEKTPKGGTK